MKQLVFYGERVGIFELVLYELFAAGSNGEETGVEYACGLCKIVERRGNGRGGIRSDVHGNAFELYAELYAGIERSGNDVCGNGNRAEREQYNFLKKRKGVKRK